MKINKYKKIQSSSRCLILLTIIFYVLTIGQSFQQYKIYSIAKYQRVLYNIQMVTADSFQKPIIDTKSVPSPRNLKSPISKSPVDDNSVLSSWNELKGLSEKELLTTYITQTDDRKQRAINLAYNRCEYVTELFSKTFYMGTTLMRPDARKHVWAIYTWCRRTDDLVDSPRALLNREHLNNDLKLWYDRLNKIWSYQPEDLFDLAMSETIQKYPELSIEPFRDMIDGMIMDVPGIGKDRYENFDELYVYCYRVAGTVGLMTLPVLGTAKGYTAQGELNFVHIFRSLLIRYDNENIVSFLNDESN